MKISTLGAAILATFAIISTASAQQADVSLKLDDLKQAISQSENTPSTSRKKRTGSGVSGKIGSKSGTARSWTDEPVSRARRVYWYFIVGQAALLKG